MNFDGIIVVNKPADWTSQDVCSKLKGRVHMKKVGHTGTLDPMATGVLPICFGKATRIIEYFDKDRKSYHASMQLGVVTDTLDSTGEVLERCKVSLVESNAQESDSSKFVNSDVLGQSKNSDKSYNSDEVIISEIIDESNNLNTMIISVDAIKKAFDEYTGEISQIPPKYSAVQINGRRAYDMARAGEKVEIKPRNITIYSNDISCIDLDGAVIEFDVTCSKGTYIRTICDDIGRALGCGACMTSLVRTSTGPFVLDADNANIRNENAGLPLGENTANNSAVFHARDLADIIAMDDEELLSIVIPMDETLSMVGTVIVDDNRVLAFENGHPSGSRTYKIEEETKFDNFYKVYGKSLSGLDSVEFIGIGQIVSGELIPYKVIADR